MRLALVPFLAFAAFGQTDSGSLSGNITDPSGAPAPGVQITVRNRATGARRTAVSQANGRYEFALLSPGDYALEARAEGFKLYRDEGFRLQVAQQAQLDIALVLGQVSETVDVRDTVSLVNTESAAQGAVISEEKIKALPLNGRQFLDLTLLVPGANAGGRQSEQNRSRLNQTGGLSSSGGRTNNNAFLLDGVANLDPDYNALSYNPIIDSLAEFQVQTSQYSAQYGRASGAQVNVVTKSGTNEIHGSVWHFLRNRVFDARPFNSVESRLPKYQRNQFGGTLGGPIVKNRLFLFGAYEGLRLRQAGAGLTTVTLPTPAQREGDFSNSSRLIFDPDSGAPRQQFPGNRIPVNRLNPLSLAAVRALPQANVPGTNNNFVNSGAVLRQDAGNYTLRADWVASSKTTVFGRYSISNEENLIPAAVPGRDTIGGARPQHAALGATTVLSSSMVNEFRAGYSRLRLNGGAPEPLFDVPNGGGSRILPRFTVTGFADMGGIGGGALLNRNNTYQVYDNVSWLKGAHALKFGFEQQWIEYNTVQVPNALGQFRFSFGQTARTSAADGTGDLLASFLLGLPQQAARALGPNRMEARQPYSGLYFQDDFKVRRNLTLNLGLRYELSEPLYDTRSQMASLDFSKVPNPQDIFASGRTAFYRPTFFICGQAGYPRSCAETDRNNFSPRLGVAWAPASRWAVRAGAGLYYSLTDASSISRQTISLPANLGQTLSGSNFLPQFRGYDVFPPTLSVGAAPLNLYALDLQQRTSYALQYSFSIQREFTRTTVGEIGYLATMGLKLQQNTQPMNTPPSPLPVDPRRPYAGAVFAPGLTFPPYVVREGEFVNSTFIGYLPNWAQSNYHALYARGERRFSRGFSLLSAFTFSKAIANAPQFRNAGGVTGAENSPPQDTYNLRAERGLTAFNTKFRWVNTVVYELPGWLRGWQIAGIISAQSGFPFTINVPGDTAGIGGGSGAILIRANPVAGQTASLPGDERSTRRWFNTRAFATPPAFQFGQLGRNTVTGPGLFNTDLNISRTLRFRGDRVRAELRGEFFNLANMPNYNQVGRILTSADFGQVLSQLPPRQIQFGLKVSF